MYPTNFLQKPTGSSIAESTSALTEEDSVIYEKAEKLFKSFQKIKTSSSPTDRQIKNIKKESIDLFSFVFSNKETSKEVRKTTKTLIKNVYRGMLESDQLGNGYVKEDFKYIKLGIAKQEKCGTVPRMFLDLLNRDQDKV